MNDPEVIMSNALANTNLVAHMKALEGAAIAIKLVMRVPAPLKSIADQVIRSASPHFSPPPISAFGATGNGVDGGGGEKCGLFLKSLTPATWFLLLVGAVSLGEKADLSQLTGGDLRCRAKEPGFRYAAARSGLGDWRES